MNCPQDTSHSTAPCPPAWPPCVRKFPTKIPHSHTKPTPETSVVKLWYHYWARTLLWLGRGRVVIVHGFGHRCRVLHTRLTLNYTTRCSCLYSRLSSKSASWRFERVPSVAARAAAERGAKGGPGGGWHLLLVTVAWQGGRGVRRPRPDLEHTLFLGQISRILVDFSVIASPLHCYTPPLIRPPEIW